MGTVTQEQVHQLLNVLSNQHTPLMDGFSQISCSTITLSDGTASTSKPQPHIIAHTVSEHPPQGNSPNSHFINAGMKNGLTVLAPTWIIDTGASCHVCSDLKMFFHTNTIDNTAVILPGGSRISVTTSGTIQISTRLTLKDVLYIPDFKYNLLSISALTHNSTISVLFSSLACFIFPDNPFNLLQEHIPGCMIGKGRLQNNIYVLDTPALSSPVLSTLHSASLESFQILSQHHSQDYVISQASSEIWHQRLGHPSHTKIDILSKLLKLSNVKNNHSDLCKICPLTKQKRISFPSNPKLSKAPFDLIHIDVWGPFQTPTHDSYKYFLTLVDDCTRVTWLYILKDKGSVATVFPEFLQFVKTQYNCNVKAIR